MATFCELGVRCDMAKLTEDQLKMTSESKTRPMIRVTEDIIARSVRDSSSHCMIADALKATIPEAKRVSVDLATIRFSIGEKRYTFATPRGAQEALLDFDAGEEVPSFQFRLHNPLKITPAKRSRSGFVRAKSSRRKQKQTLKSMKGKGVDAEVSTQTIKGGKPLPVGPLSNDQKADAIGRRRAYGLRAMATRFSDYKREKGE